MEIPFTQYLLPDGRTKKVLTDCPEGKEAKVQALLDNGAYFEAEILTTGEVSFTCEVDVPGTNETLVLAHEMCPNGPEVLEAIPRLIDTAYGKYEVSSPERDTE